MNIIAGLLIFVLSFGVSVAITHLVTPRKSNKPEVRAILRYGSDKGVNEVAALGLVRAIGTAQVVHQITIGHGKFTDLATLVSEELLNG